MELMNSPQQVHSDLSLRIKDLETLINSDTEGVEIKSEMDNLKKALMENPAACLLLADEDIGILVQGYRKITGIAISSASSKSKPKTAKPKTKQLTQEELLTALDDPDF